MMRKDTGSTLGMESDPGFLDVRQQLGFYARAHVSAKGPQLSTIDSDDEGDNDNDIDNVDLQRNGDADIDSFSDLSSFIPNPHTFYASADPSYPQKPQLDQQSSLVSHQQQQKSQSFQPQSADRKPVPVDPWANAADESLWSSSSSSKISYRTRSDSHNTALSGQDVISPISPQWIWGATNTPASSSYSDAASSGGFGLGLFIPTNDAFETNSQVMPDGKTSSLSFGVGPILSSPSNTATSLAKKDDLWDSSLTRLAIPSQDLQPSHDQSEPHSAFGVHHSFVHSPNHAPHGLEDTQRVGRSQSLKASFQSARHQSMSSHTSQGRQDPYLSQQSNGISNAFSQSYQHQHQHQHQHHVANPSVMQVSIDAADFSAHERDVAILTATDPSYSYMAEIEHSFVYSPVDSPHFAKSSFMDNSASSSPSMAFSPREAALSHGQYSQHQYQALLQQQQNTGRGIGMGFNQGLGANWPSPADRVSSLQGNAHICVDNRPRSRSGGLPQFTGGSYGGSGGKDESLLTKLQNLRMSPNVKASSAFAQSPTMGRFGASPKTASPFGSPYDSPVNQMTSLLPLHDPSAAFNVHAHLMDTSDFIYGANAILYCDVEFKASRKETFMYPSGNSLSIGDFVIVEADRGQDLGRVARLHPQGYSPKSPTATLPSAAGTTPTADSVLASGKNTPSGSASLGMQSHILQADGYDMGDGFGGNGDSASSANTAPKKTIRRAHLKEIQQLSLKAAEEQKALIACQTKVKQRNLPMEVIDAEYQFDRKKLTYYFKAVHRIDFRELVRDLFRIFKTRIWLKQTDGRQGRQVIACGDA